MTLPRPASDYEQLCFHGLTYLPVAGPSSLFAPRYHRWAQERLPPGAISPFTEDAAVIAGLYDRADRSLSLQLIPLLYDSVDALLSGASRDLDELDPTEIADSTVLAELLKLDRPLVELFRAALALAAPAYRDAYSDRLSADVAASCADLTPDFEEAFSLLSDLAEHDVFMTCALGAHGRALSGRIYVGMSAPGDLPKATPVVLALHEAAVSTAAEAVGELPFAQRYVCSEWEALRVVTTAMRRASPGLQSAHRAWLESLDLTSLCEAARDQGLVDRDAAMQIARERSMRSELLR